MQNISSCRERNLFVKLKINICSLCFIFIFCWSSIATAHTPSDPNFLRPDYSKNWKTLTTAHFHIHHEAAQQKFAQQMGAIAEQVHSKLTGWLGWKPEEATEIVILDNVDFSNGAATVLPYNQFYIYMPTPVEGEIMDQNPWMEYVFTHEYIHILHLDMAFGLPKAVRDIIGRPLGVPMVATFPELFAPSWLTEGLAVYGESDNAAGYGRLNNAWFEASMRMEVQRGLRSLTELSFEGYSGSRWPYGQNYLYGAYFFKFISERYGRDEVVKYIQTYGYNLIPWRMDERSMLIFGKPAQEIWSEYQTYLHQRFEPQLAKLKQESIVTRPVYTTPYINRSLTAASNGDLYFYHDDSSSHPQLRRIKADGSNEFLFEAENVTGLAWQDEAGLLLNKQEVCDNVALYTDLYRWKPGMLSPERMTHCGRYVRAAWRSDGQQIAAVQLEQGISRLVLLDAKGQHVEVLAEMTPNDTLGHIDWSPDNKQLIASVKRQHSGWNLELFDLNERLWHPLTVDNNRKVHPHFSQDGLSVYFISDHDKVWNLRQLRLTDNTIATLSNSTSGIYEAVAMPDTSYRLVEYSAQGEILSALPASAAANRRYVPYTTAATQVVGVVNTVNYQPLPYENVKDYSSWDTVKPRSWVPFVALSADQNSYAGVSLYGADMLGFHQWTAAPYIYLDQNTLGGFTSYNYRNTLTLIANEQSFIVGNNNDLGQYRSEEIRYQALLHHSFNSTESSFYFSGGVSNQHIKYSLTRNSGIYSIYQDTLAGVIARYDNTEFYKRSISQSDGRRVQFTGESYDLVGMNYHSGKTIGLDWKEYFTLGGNHVLYLRMLLAKGDDGISPYLLGGEIEAPDMLDGSTDLGRRRYLLRGYPHLSAHNSV
jgi:hypothetical protein